MPYVALNDRLALLPLVLCGPMLRRVDPTSVTVFVALKEPRRVTLTVTHNNQQFSGQRDTVAIGANLHVVAVTANGNVTAGSLYTYNLEFAAIGGGGQSLGLMSPGAVSATAADALLALTYRHVVPTAPGLPSFIAPPLNPRDLRVVHVSCRKPHGPGIDALPIVDDMIEGVLRDPGSRPRPHLLVHTGDQIYADDVAVSLLHTVIDSGAALLGWNPGEKLPLTTGALVPSVIGAGARQVVLDQSKLTSGEGTSHLLGFGEFCAMYVMAWSPTIWPEDLPTHDQVAQRSGAGPIDPHWRLAALKYIYEHYAKEKRNIDQGYRPHLTKVRRLLANVPSFMQFDDHEITDDWFRNLHWLKDSQDPGTAAGRLGRAIVRNGMASYAVFQAWGNTPEQFDGSPTVNAGARILGHLAAWNTKVGADDPDITGTNGSLARALGLPVSFTSDRPILDASTCRWHYRVDWPNVQLIALDTRTSRVTPGSANESPALLFDPIDLDRQISGPPPPAEGLTILLSPAPVFGGALHEWLGEKATSFRVIKSPEFADPEHWALQPVAVHRLLSRMAVRGQVAPDNIIRTRTVILSGDVHYGFSIGAKLDGLPAHRARPTPTLRGSFAQLTASAAKNQASLTGMVAWTSHFGGLPDGLLYGWLVPTTAHPIDGDGVEIVAQRFSENPSPRRPPRLPDWTVALVALADNRGFADRLLPNFLVPPDGGNAQDRLVRTKWVLDKRNPLSHSRVVGLNNIGDIEFDWNAGDSKAVIHRLWFRYDDGVAQPYTRHIVDMKVDS